MIAEKYNQLKQEYEQLKQRFNRILGIGILLGIILFTAGLFIGIEHGKYLKEKEVINIITSHVESLKESN